MEREEHCIIITTARKESMRQFTEQQLKDCDIFYDQLIMGIGHGERIVVNDRDLDGNNRARAFNLDRNTGFENLKV